MHCCRRNLTAAATCTPSPTQPPLWSCVSSKRIAEPLLVVDELVELHEPVQEVDHPPLVIALDCLLPWQLHVHQTVPQKRVTHRSLLKGCLLL